MKLFKCLAVILILTLLTLSLSGCFEKKEEPEKPAPEEVTEPIKEGEQEEETTSLTLYFADDQAIYLLAEEREIPKTKTPAKATLEELIKGPEKEGHFSTIPEGTKLNSVSIKDGLASVDFSEEFKTNYPLGSAAEMMTVYSIVNTLTEFSAIKEVKFLVDGEPLDIPGSNFDFTVQKFSRNEDLIKKDG